MCKRSIRWVNREGSSLPIPDSVTAGNNMQFDSTFIVKVQDGTELADTSLLAFRDPENFLAGQLHDNFDHW